MNKNKYYLTTAIPYVNASPHIGFALEAIQADVVARYYRLSGVNTFLLTGADENSLKNVKAAKEKGISTKELCDKFAKEFASLKETLNFSYDNFLRSSDKEHHFPGAQKLWGLIEESGDFYKKIYEGLYCVGCELFYTEEELLDGKCPEHKVAPEKIKEENYFFKLSKYQRILEELIETDEIKIRPMERKNEVLGFIRKGLEDFSVSRSKERSKGWGVPVPNDPDQTIYVWVEALGIYLTGIGFGTDEETFKKWWPADAHLIGKGILRFHAVYWPALLLSAKLELPKSIYVHGYLTVEGEKISKSLGNVISPTDVIKKYGLDPLRYFLLKDIPFGSDGDFSFQRFEEVYQADLANGLGNLVSRVAKLAELVDLEVHAVHEKPLFDTAYSVALEDFRFNDALSYIWKKISESDKKIEEVKLWEVVKNDPERAKDLLSNLVRQIREITELLLPLLPSTAEKIQKHFTGPKIKAAPPLFPRLR